MKIDAFSESGGDGQWSSRFDSQIWSIEMSLRTEGVISFGGPNNTKLNVFLLELFLEIKAVILLHFGNKQFDRHISMPFSGDGISIKRNVQNVFIYRDEFLLEESEWVLFLVDLKRVQDELQIKMKEVFPEFMKTPESRLIFS